MPDSLLEHLRASADRRPGHVATDEASERLFPYAELNALSDRVRDQRLMAEA